MKRVLVGAFATVVISSSTSAVASDWVFVSVDRNVAVAVDLESIRPIRTVIGQPAVAIWSASVFSVPQLRGNDLFDYRLTRFVIDCNADTIASTASVGYEMNDSPTVFSDTNTAAARAIIPDSIGELFRNAACGAKLESVGLGSVSDAALIARSYLTDDTVELPLTVADLNDLALAVIVGAMSARDASAAAGEAQCVTALGGFESCVGTADEAAVDAARAADEAATNAARAAAIAVDAAVAADEAAKAVDKANQSSQKPN